MDREGMRRRGNNTGETHRTARVGMPALMIKPSIDAEDNMSRSIRTPGASGRPAGAATLVFLLAKSETCEIDKRRHRAAENPNRRRRWGSHARGRRAGRLWWQLGRWRLSRWQRDALPGGVLHAT